MASTLFDSMLISRAAELHALCAQSPMDLDLPRIVAIGNQSSGKSSVVESIVMRRFLPRGNGIVTRCPIELHLRHSSDAQESVEILENTQTETWRSLALEEVHQEIEDRTIKNLGGHNGISKTPIVLRFRSPHILDLTLVDLPGLTRVCVSNQPADIVSQIEQLALDYISRPESLILVITAANTNIANCEGHRLALAADPGRVRTLGVLTKLDIMDAGTDVGAVLRGESVDAPSLRLGYIGVVNRCQEDTHKGINIQDGLRKEMEFLKGSPVYSPLLNLSVSTPVLARRLSRHLACRLREILPALHAKLRQAEADLALHRASLGNSANGFEQRQEHLRRILLEFKRLFETEIGVRRALNGNMHSVQGRPTRSTLAATRIKGIFCSLAASLRSMVPLKGFTDDDISRILTETRTLGPSLLEGLSLTDGAFETLVRQELHLIRPFLQRCATEVLEAIRDASERSVEGAIPRFHSAIATSCPERVENTEQYPLLKQSMKESVGSCIHALEAAVSQAVVELLEYELAYINTAHPDFVNALRGAGGPATPVRESWRSSSSRLLAGLMHFGCVSSQDTGGHASKRRKISGANTPQLNQMAEANAKQEGCDGSRSTASVQPFLRQVVGEYVRIVQRDLADKVPKALMAKAVNNFDEKLFTQLLAALDRPEKVDSLMQEGEGIADARHAESEKANLIQRSLRILSDIDVALAGVAPSGQYQ